MPREFPPTPLVGVGAVVVRGSRVLLVRRARPPRRGEWSLPGGLQRLGETVFAAAAREVMEETGVLARPFGIIDVVDLIEPAADRRRIRYHYTLIDVVADWLEGEPAAGSDAADARWVEAGAAAELVAWPETRRIIAHGCRMAAAPRPAPTPTVGDDREG